jgi:hypothetical protein
MAIAALFVSACTALAQVVVIRLEIGIYFELWDGGEYDQEYHSQLAEIGANVDRFALVFLPLLVFAWIFWMYRAHQNLAHLQVGRLGHYSHSTIWTWFIPIFNFWAPYQVMSEIYRRSQPQRNELCWNPFGGAILGIWWACWLLSSLTAMVSNSIVMRTERDDTYVWATALMALAQILRICAAGLAMALVVLVDYNQARRRFELSTETAKSSVPAPLSAP